MCPPTLSDRHDQTETEHSVFFYWTTMDLLEFTYNLQILAVGEPFRKISPEIHKSHHQGVSPKPMSAICNQKSCKIQ